MLEPTQSQLVDANSDQISTITGAPPTIIGKLTWRLINDEDGTSVIAESPDGIVEIDDGRDPPLRRYDRAFTAPGLAGRFLAIWRYFQEEVSQTVVVSASGADTAFATVAEVTKRLGRPLDSEETASIPFLLNMAAVVIADAAGYDDGWAVSLDPVPRMLRNMSVELVCRALPNPSQYSTWSQQVGSYNFQADASSAGMVLSPLETMMVRRAVHGRTTASARVDSGFQRAQDEYWLRKQSVRFADPGNVIP